MDNPPLFQAAGDLLAKKLFLADGGELALAAL